MKLNPVPRMCTSVPRMCTSHEFSTPKRPRITPYVYQSRINRPVSYPVCVHLLIYQGVLGSDGPAYTGHSRGQIHKWVENSTDCGQSEDTTMTPAQSEPIGPTAPIPRAKRGKRQGLTPSPPERSMTDWLAEFSTKNTLEVGKAPEVTERDAP